MYKKILIATDGSEFASAAIDHGVKLAARVEASVVFVTVTETWSAFHMAENLQDGVPNPVQAYVASTKESAQKILAEAKAVADAASVVSQSVHVSDSFAAEGIIETAEKHECDLIIMASHGRRGLGRMLLGSQTSEVLGFTTLPVLVLR
jgi:nucleotide-binding universal stress UspA family protein